MITIGAAIIGLIGTAAGIYFKYLRTPATAADTVSEREHAMAEDAANRPDDGSTVDRLQRGKF